MNFRQIWHASAKSVATKASAAFRKLLPEMREGGALEIRISPA
jgi:hypothetical protein